MPSALFRFDATKHTYVDLATGTVRPHITGMLERGGWIDDRWYTEEASVRGTEVHRMTAEYDLGALDVASCVSTYRGWLLAHVKATSIMLPEYDAVEEAEMHPVHKFGGRIDRRGRVYGAKGIVEIKTGDFDKSHQIQTALQAILAAEHYKLPAEYILRFGLYLKDSGKFKLEQFTQRADFVEARRLIRKYCYA